MDTLHEFYVYTKGVEYLIAVAFLLLFPYFWSYLDSPRKVRKAATEPRLEPAHVHQVPAGVFVGPGHAWLRLLPKGAVTLGAGRLPVLLLGGLDRIVASEPGTEVRRGEPLAVLHRNGRTLTLPSPVDGKVVEVNPRIGSDPGLLAADPFGQGWLVRLSPKNLGAAAHDMFVAERAGAWMRQELAKLRDLVVGLATPSPQAQLTDGGLPVAGLASRLTDDAWKELCDRLFTVQHSAGERPAPRPTLY